MSVKIQINSLAALERLIGEDSELEMELRYSVVDQFTRKHLKVLAEEYKTNGLVKALTTEIREGLFAEVSWSSAKVSKKYEGVLSEHISMLLRKKVSELVTQKLNTESLEARLDRIVNDRLYRIVNDIAVDELKKTAKEAVIAELNKS